MKEKTRKQMLKSFEKHIASGCSSEILGISKNEKYGWIDPNHIIKYCSGYQDAKISSEKDINALLKIITAVRDYMMQTNHEDFIVEDVLYLLGFGRDGLDYLNFHDLIGS
jgi:hypothetical protein